MHTKNGFSLVEVLVASLVIMLGVTGYVTLQSEYVVANSNLNLRSIAIQLAKDKLSDLGYFQQLRHSGAVANYTKVNTNQGGSIPAGDRLVLLSSNAANTHVFNTSWQVNEFFYVDKNSDGHADSWVQTGDLHIFYSPPQFSHMKSVAITLSWKNLEGEQKTFGLSVVIIPLPMARSFQAKHRAKGSSAYPLP